MTNTPPGWYPDPSGAPGQRYFDGTDWTERRAAGQPVLPQPKKSKNGIILGSVGAVLALSLIIGIVNGGDEKKSTVAKPSAPSSSVSTVAPVPVFQNPSAPPPLRLGQRYATASSSSGPRASNAPRR